MARESNFPQTRFSMIQRIQDGDEANKNEAMASFMAQYRPALVDFLVKCKRVDPTDADDLVQDFLLNKVMNGNVLDLANGKGRFRNALRTCLQRSLIDAIRKQKRERTSAAIELDYVDDEREIESASLDEVWALAVFRNVLLRLKKESDHWDLFVDRVLTHPPLSYPQVIERHGYESPEKASNFLMTAKRQFNRIMTETIREQSELGGEFSDEDIEKEIGYIKARLLDSRMIENVISGLAESDLPLNLSASRFEHSIVGARVVFIDDQANDNWELQELRPILDHLLDRPVDAMVENPYTRSLNVRRLIESGADEPQNLEILKQLKDEFNVRGKSKVSELPQRINVTMTFLMIASYVNAGGEVESITSMRRDILAERLSQLSNKDWLPAFVVDTLKASQLRLLQ